jgi:exodeoxyribonuclease-3
VDEVGHAGEAGREVPLALCGDWNVAPADDDVWDPAAFVGSTHVTPRERAALRELAAGAGLRDVVRERNPDGPGPFSYWDYRAGDFPKGRGMRIDLVLLSASALGGVTSAVIDRQARKGRGASDHAPVVVDLTL